MDERVEERAPDARADLDWRKPGRLTRRGDSGQTGRGECTDRADMAETLPVLIATSVRATITAATTAMPAWPPIRRLVSPVTVFK